MKAKSILAVLYFITCTGKSAIATPYFQACASAQIETREALTVSGKIAPRLSNVIRSRWGDTITKFHKGPGDIVKQGEVIAEIDLSRQKRSVGFYKRNVELSRQNLKRAEVELTWGRKNFERLKEKVNRGLSAKKEVEGFEVNLVNYANNIRRQRAALDKAEKRYNDLMERLEKSNYIAPIDGVISEMIVNPSQVFGSYRAPPNSVIVKIDKPGAYSFTANVLGHQVTQIEVGQECELQIAEFRVPCTIASVATIGQPIEKPGFGGKESHGLLWYPVKIEFESDQVIPLEKRALAQVYSNQLVSRQSIPWNAVLVEKGETYVEVADGEKGWRRRSVRISGSDFSGTLALLENEQPLTAKCYFW